MIVALVGLFAVQAAKDDNRAAERAESRPLAPPGAEGLLSGIGPAPGADVTIYANSRQQALAQATGDRVAVVSLREYVTETKARSVVARTAVVGLLAAAAGGEPSLVEGDLDAWVEDQRRASVEEREEFRKLIPTVDDPQFRDEYQQQVDRLTELIDGVEPGGNLVFGVVVRAPASELQALAGAPDVRLVDVGPDAALPDDAEYRGFRPEEVVRSGEPATRPL